MEEFRDLGFKCIRGLGFRSFRDLGFEALAAAFWREVEAWLLKRLKPSFPPRSSPLHPKLKTRISAPLGRKLLQSNP